ncbi:MAG: sphingomyelin phosphodiesterase [Bacteriovoracaceae bacterium]|jgi:endonuclease/exonuclease/phosphatase family metal-dependent hydrolase|nr:sphingomyelin phosphodiesterase [Bacteriovoracaceae bacterium]
MKKVMSVGLILITLYPFAVFSSILSPIHLKVLSLNTWMIPILRKEAKVRSKLIGTYSRKYDVIAFQEMFSLKHRNITTNYLNKAKSKFFSKHQSSSLLLNSGLFNLSKYKIIKSSFKKFKHCRNVQCVSAKGVLHTRIELDNSFELDLFNTHTEPFKKGKKVRLKQLQTLLQFIRKVNDGKRPVILFGDLNIIANSSEYDDMIELFENEGFKDVWAYANGELPGYTWNSYLNPWGTIDGANKSKERIDYVFIRSGNMLSIGVHSSNIVFDKALSLQSNDEKYFLSDHFGVEASLVLY